MKYKRKTLTILILAVALALLFTMTAYAVRRVHVEGFVPLESLVEGPVFLEYDVCDPFLVGHAVQYDAPSGKSSLGTIYVNPALETACPEPSVYLPDAVGTCDFALRGVEEFGNPDSKEGKAVLLDCTGDLVGLQAQYVIHYDFTYDGWYYVNP